MKNIFNVTDEGIKILAGSGESEKLFYRYKSGGTYKYYGPLYAHGVGPCTISITDVKYDGLRYQISYGVYRIDIYGEGLSEEDLFLCDMLAFMELKTIDGDQYWSMYSNEYVN